jgi:KDO2-lipid IV(A) lauroyltransferase
MRYRLYKAFTAAGRAFIGFSNAPAIGRVLACVFRLLVPSRFALSIEAIAFHLDKPRQEAKQLARESLAENFTSFTEILLNHKVNERFWAENLEIADRMSFDIARSTDRPIIFATAHLGAWELLAGVLADVVDAPSKQVVVRRPKDEALYRIMAELRGVKDIDVLEHRNAAPKLLRSLKRGGAAAFLVDHNCSRDEAVFLPFLKRTAAVNAGPALLAVRTGALILPVFLVRLEPGRYRLHTENPLDPRDLRGERREKIRSAAEFYTNAVERYVREYPEQWFWIHKRWKTRPPDEGAEDGQKVEAEL